MLKNSSPEVEYSIRDMQSGEEIELWRLFYNTVHQINARDYTGQQTSAWAPADREKDTQGMDDWRTRIRGVKPFVAVAPSHARETASVSVSVENARMDTGAAPIIGFADLQTDGLVDFFFVHHLWQGRGVARALMREIELRASKQSITELYAHVSITAQPMFQRYGFIAESVQTVQIRGVEMRNAVMRRRLR